jgi:hypothetical protein
MYEPVPERLTSGSAAAGGVWLALAALTRIGTPAAAAMSAVATMIA